jgi:hypothetical protein
MSTTYKLHQLPTVGVEVRGLGFRVYTDTGKNHNREESRTGKQQVQ